MSVAKVFHNQNDKTLFHAKPADYNPVDYKLVAEVVGGDEKFSDSEDFLEYAYERTNSTFQYWGLNKGVKDITGKNRSTSVGDVIELIEGGVHTLYIVSSIGFTKITGANCPLLAGYALCAEG